ncbi:MAG TPA: 50S ribosomal protein L18 [Candidatus Binatia bacterium]|jgi:large subunit ribosomal protein L18|nr:50S ribosomal protein L18 [Candidatus Binatia bacterium]
MSTKNKSMSRMSRKRRVRAKVSGTAERPRLSVYRSATHIYAQLIDDAAGKTLASASDLALDKKEKASLMKGEGERKAKVAVAFAVGKTLAEAGKKAGVATVVFDRNGFAYTGRIAALADGAREGGLKF